MEQRLDLWDMRIQDPQQDTQDPQVSTVDSAELVLEINLYPGQELAPKIDSPGRAPRQALSRQ